MIGSVRNYTSYTSSSSTSTQNACSQQLQKNLNRMIADLSKQYSLDDAAPVCTHLNVAT